MSSRHPITEAAFLAYYAARRDDDANAVMRDFLALHGENPDKTNNGPALVGYWDRVEARLANPDYVIPA